MSKYDLNLNERMTRNEEDGQKAVSRSDLDPWTVGEWAQYELEGFLPKDAIGFYIQVGTEQAIRP